MSELFQTTKQNISLHIKNVFDESELQENSVVKEYLTTAPDGKRYLMDPVIARIVRVVVIVFVVIWLLYALMGMSSIGPIFHR
jgi:hypothetical protein